MFARTLTAIGLVLALAAPASAGQISFGASKDRAVDACVGINDYAPTKVVETADDGMGDWLVWVEDKDGDLWMCNASEEGAVYANVLMEGDLLGGDGVELIGNRQSGDRGFGSYRPAATAETVCATVGNLIEDVEIVATVSDGLGDYLVWLQNANEELWMCNASGDAQLYSFEPVDMPINDYEPIELRDA
jgi:hypothetical protein